MKKFIDERTRIAIEVIKDAINAKGINVKKILLFGSRARGEDKPFSDWDFFVIVDKKLSFHEKWDIIDKIKIELARLKIPNDILIKSEEDVINEKEIVGRITYYALKEGVEL